MATFEITGVRLEASSEGPRHEHISKVRIGRDPGFVLDRSTVVADLRKVGGDRYFTRSGNSTAEVEVVNCPSCSFGDYIRSKADATTADNLLSLPPA